MEESEETHDHYDLTDEQRARISNIVSQKDVPRRLWFNKKPPTVSQSLYESALSDLKLAREQNVLHRQGLARIEAQQAELTKAVNKLTTTLVAFTAKPAKARRKAAPKKKAAKKRR